MSDNAASEAEAFVEHQVKPLADLAWGAAFGFPVVEGEVFAEDVRWHCSRCAVDGTGPESLNEHLHLRLPEHLPGDVKRWRQITGIRLLAVSLDREQSIFPGATFEVVQPKPIETSIPINAHRLTRLFGLWCTQIGAPWHPGCRELPHRTRMHAAYHRRNR